MFYTALYHTGMQPNLFIDADGRYFGMDLKPHQGRVDEPIYTIFSLWDTFRAYHPLMTIIDPELNEAFIRSLIQKSREGGVLPMWELAGNYTGTMIGYHAASLIADSYVKGYRNLPPYGRIRYDGYYHPSFGCAASDAAGQVLEEQDWLRALR